MLVSIILIGWNNSHVMKINGKESRLGKQEERRKPFFM